MQDLIQSWFAAHASLAIVVLLLICVFLVKEAWHFYPQSYDNIRYYRLTGQEFVDYLQEEVDRHAVFAGDVKRAHLAEIHHAARAERDRLQVYLSLVVQVQEEAVRETRHLEASFEQLEKLSEEFDARAAALDQARQSGGDLTGIEREMGRIATQRQAAERRLLKNQQDYRAAATRILAGVRPGHLLHATAVSPEEFEQLKAAAAEALPRETAEPALIQALRAREAEKVAAARQHDASLGNIAEALATQIEPLDALLEALREAAMASKDRNQRYLDAPVTHRTLLAGADLAERQGNSEEAALYRQQAKEITFDPPPYEELTRPMYEAVQPHAQIAASLRSGVADLLNRLPAEAESHEAVEHLRQARLSGAALLEFLERNAGRVRSWSHAVPVHPLTPWREFFTDHRWVTNSPWREIYGFTPFLVGSLIISVIALGISIPFSVGAAIYVNQVASRREQELLKPAIEFIQALPSIVLGFFGIMVLGETLRDLSHLPWLSWVPGFPMTHRLNMLNAGLLLAFMAAPTIFTLSEDALNNVPRAYSQASFALGASKIETVMMIMVPAARSGILAAILLGFGRIIGETMVVLLVAGNRVAIPDFRKGLGVLTEPAHTMTGIIAQNTGEAAIGSLSWTALFLIGVVLFFNSLVVNLVAQAIVHRKHG